MLCMLSLKTKQNNVSVSHVLMTEISAAFGITYFSANNVKCLTQKNVLRTFILILKTSVV